MPSRRMPSQIAREAPDGSLDSTPFLSRPGGGFPALTAFSAVGRAYLAFAKRYPGHYMAMFESGISPHTSDVVGQVALKARQVMDQATEALLAHIPADRRPPVAMVSAHIAAMSHGVIELHARPPAGSSSPYSPEDLLESGVGIYLRGLGILPPDR